MKKEIKRESIYKKHIEVIIKSLIGIYFVVGFLLTMNGNSDAFYLNLLGVSMIAVPILIGYID